PRGPGHHRAALRRADDGDAPSAPELEQALLPEQVKRAQDGVLVHPEHRREVLGQRKALAGPGLAVRDGPPDLRRNLVMEGEGIGAIDVDIHHGTSHSSSMLQLGQRPAAQLDTTLQVFFSEARRCRRRRWLAGGAVVLLLAAITAAVA